MARGITGIAPQILKRLKRIPGTARQYIDPNTGTEYSRRAVQQAKVGASNEAAARATKIAQTGILPFEENVDQLFKKYQAKKKRDGEPITKKAAYANNSEFLKALRDLKSSDKTKGIGPRSKKAKALETLGIRPANSQYRVGESPGTKSHNIPKSLRKSRRESVTGRR